MDQDRDPDSSCDKAVGMFRTEDFYDIRLEILDDFDKVIDKSVVSGVFTDEKILDPGESGIRTVRDGIIGDAPFLHLCRLPGHDKAYSELHLPGHQRLKGRHPPDAVIFAVSDRIIGRTMSKPEYSHVSLVSV
jgi:hypothetical protein